MNLPYWLEVALVIILFVGFFKRLYEIFFLGIADPDAYEANKEQREKDEAYKAELKKKKKEGSNG